MPWKPIVAGVDDSPEGIRAANVAYKIAKAAEVECYLTHAAPQLGVAGSPYHEAVAVFELNEAVTRMTRDRLAEVLCPSLPDPLVGSLDVRIGRPAGVISTVAHEHDAELVVLGAKHHAAITRWVGGSTAHNVIRTTDIPVLVARAVDTKIRRVLAAVDASSATKPTLEAAVRFAKLFSAELRVLHVIEHLPLIAALPVRLDKEEYYTRSEEYFRELVSDFLTATGVTCEVRCGDPTSTIVEDVSEFGPDLLVAGSHGKGFTERVIVGSTTERLLNHLPTSMLVIPVAAADEEQQRAMAKSSSEAHF